MADMDYDDDGTDAPTTGALTAVVNWTGAALSVGLVVGLSVWGYQLTMRDVSEVPVIRALEGPMREAPEDPGGMAADHQGLAVNAVQADGGVEEPPNRVVLAPEPIDLTEEDKPRGALRPPSREDAIAEGVSIPEAIRIAEAERMGREFPDPGPLGVSLAEESVTPVPDAAAGTETSADAAAADSPDILSTSVPGLRRSPRPAPRPEMDIAARQNLGAADRVGPARTELDPAALAAGTRLAQLGAFDDAETARAEWDRLVAAHDDLLADKQRVVQKAESGGRVFYRLRVAGFDGVDDSRRFCSALLARDTACIPVTAR